MTKDLNKSESKYLVNSIAKALDIVDIFDAKEPRLSMTEISEELDISTSTLYPILFTLKEKGYLNKDHNKKYTLGLKFLEKSNLILESLDIRSAARSHLQDLARSIGGNAHLALLHNGEVLYLEREEGNPGVTIKEIVGRRVPAYCTALGKVLLAQLDETEFEKYIQKTELTPKAPNTITNPEELQTELEKVRDQGYALDNEEFHENLLAIASPVRNYKNEIVAAISISFPKSKYPNLQVEKPLKKIKRAAKSISSELGAAQ